MASYFGDAFNPRNMLSYFQGCAMPEEAGGEFSCIAFTQDSLCLAIGHKNGYEFYPLAKNSGDDVVVEHRNKMPETVIVERLLSYGLVMVVSKREPRTMHVYRLADQKTIHDQRFSSSIVNIKLNRHRVVVCLEGSIHIYNLKDMKKLHTIEDIPSNPSGLIDISLGNSMLAYPGSTTTGRVCIFDADNLKSLHTLDAHENPIAALRLDSEGVKLATASVKGTVIRIFCVKKDQQPTKLFEFRRGVARAVSIYNLAFSADSTFLASSSNTETVHVFKLQTPEETAAEQESSWTSWALSTVSSYLPSQILEKSFATAHLPAASRAYAVLPTIDGQTMLSVATADGNLYMYKLDTTNGGECEILKQHHIGPDVISGPSRTVDTLGEDAPPRNHAA